MYNVPCILAAQGASKLHEVKVLSLKKRIHSALRVKYLHRKTNVNTFLASNFDLLQLLQCPQIFLFQIPLFCSIQFFPILCSLSSTFVTSELSLFSDFFNNFPFKRCTINWKVGLLFCLFNCGLYVIDILFANMWFLAISKDYSMVKYCGNYSLCYFIFQVSIFIGLIFTVYCWALLSNAEHDWAMLSIVEYYWALHCG